ncbi:Patatin-like phospholipase [Stigmatella aurantiaca]|uniref:Patatin-like phospholipase n=1 Tax=Stigmatella aurantiaca TaxID=41 RepID=A0A1H7FNM9_STIAU|nr:patatin-like phospholipase family protein [Stigmatella aurantiaca]SEK27578.1 Patatin-like phospholipase [Stigmatella aurantiaca]
MTHNKLEPVKTGAPNHSHQLPPYIYASELTEIKIRRRVLGLPAPTGESGAQPSPKHGLVGLALSGGGIRSSTFSLGVIQALACRLRPNGGTVLPDGMTVFEKVDYLSTVSGGGYTGALLSSLLGTPGAEHAPFPLQKPLGQNEPPLLQHLRNGSNYLSPGGLLDQLRLPFQVARGLLLNIALVFPWILLAVFGTELLYKLSYHLPGTGFIQALVAGGTVLLAAAVLSFALFSRRFRHVLGWKERNRIELGASALFGLVLFAALLAPITSVVVWAIEIPWKLDDTLAKVLGELSTAFLRWVLLLMGGLGAVGVLLWKQLRRVWELARGKLTLYALSLVGPGVIFATYVLLCMYYIESPSIHPSYKELLRMAPPQRSTEGVMVPGEFTKLFNHEVNRENGYCAIKLGRLDEGWLIWTMADGQQGCPLPNPCMLQDEGGCTSDQNVPNFWHLKGGQKTFLTDATLRITTHYRPELWPQRDLPVLALAVVWALLTLLLLDINSTSLHGFYRDRLSKLYLVRPVDQSIESTDELKLSELNNKGEGSAAPYHLVNATLNLHGSSELELRGRKSDFFIFSKNYCGSPHTGFCPTADLEQVDPRINLGAAMAISGAAAAPNMGTLNLNQLRFLMAMLNARLSYWVPNPRRVVDKGTASWRWPSGPGALHLLCEASGFLDASGPYVNVSDGGHLENLGVYELLRRRCKVIIAIDGEADPDMKFPSLHTLMRYAWIDLGVRIELKLDELRPMPGGMPSQHITIGTIHYGRATGGDELRGTFVYIKSSVTGDENLVISDYRAAQPKFPHESTADQFFTEHQFESYRALGEHIGESLLEMKEFTVLFGAEAPKEPTRTAETQPLIQVA